MATKSVPKGSAKARQNKQSKQANAGQADAIALLKQDHRTVEGLFSQYRSASSSDEKARLAQQVCKELIVHTKLEEELFYPACREKGVKDDMLDKAQVEHDAAKILIGELMTGSPDTSFYDAKVMVLSEYIKMHVREEENSSDGIFAKAKAAGVDMNALGQSLQTRKQELVSKAESRGFAPPAPRSLEQLSQLDYGDKAMARQDYQGRDEQGRFTGEDDRRYMRGEQSRGRYEDDDDYGRRGSYQSRSNERERDDQGRFTSGRNGDNDQSRGGGRGYYGESSQRGWEGRGSGRDYDEDRRGSRSYSRSGSDDDYRSSGRGQGGWFGDPEGHSRASEQGWEGRRGGGNGDRDDDRGGSRYSRSGSDDDYRSSGRGHGGWFGDPEGHSRASEQGWEGRRGGSDYDDDRRGSRSQSRSRSDDDYRSSGGSSGGGGHGGWFGDSRGHAEAARRGWRDR